LEPPSKRRRRASKVRGGADADEEGLGEVEEVEEEQEVAPETAGEGSGGKPGGEAAAE
jgi:hypothetical protein